jgi:hypothetical protein
MRSLTEVLVSLVTNVLLLILWVALAGFFLCGLVWQIKFLFDWLSAKGNQKAISDPPLENYAPAWWGLFVIIPLIMWFTNK